MQPKLQEILQLNNKVTKVVLLQLVAKPVPPPATTTTVKGGPKAAGTASQLNQIEGNNTNIISRELI